MNLILKIVEKIFYLFSIKFKNFFNDAKLRNELDTKITLLFNQYIESGNYFGYLDDIEEYGLITNYIELVFNQEDDVDDYILQNKVIQTFNEKKQKILKYFLIDIKDKVIATVADNCFDKNQQIVIKHILKNKANQFDFAILSKVYPYNKEIIERENLLQEIDRLLEEKRYVAIYGIAGIGKSELAKYYANYAVKYDKFDVIHWSVYSESLLNTIRLIDVIGINKDTNLESYFYSFIECLRMYNKKILLVIDNVSTINEEYKYFQELMSIKNCYILITCKKLPFEIFELFHFPVLDENDFIKIFKKIVNKTPTVKQKIIIKEISKKIYKHTMAFVIICKQIANGKISLHKTLANLNKYNLNNEFETTIIKDNEIFEKRAIDLISKLFKINSLNDNLKLLLMEMNYVPLDGISVSLLRKFSSCSEKDLQYLIDMGYICSTEDMVFLHPILNILIVSELKNRVVACNKFLNNFYHHYNTDKSKIYYLLEVLEKIDYIPNKSICEMVGYVASHKFNFGDYNCALNYRQLQMEYINKLPVKKDICLQFEVKNNLALTFKMLGKCKVAGDYYNECIQLFPELPEKVKNKDFQINFWVNLGGYFIEINDFDQAKLYLKNAYDEVVKTDYSYFLFSKVARNYAKCLSRNPENSSRERQQAIKILEKILKQEYNNENDIDYIVDKAITLNNLGKRYNEDLSDFNTAEKYYNESIDLLTKTDKKNLYAIISNNAANNKLQQYKLTHLIKDKELLLSYVNKSLIATNDSKDSKTRLDTLIVAAEVNYELLNKEQAIKFSKQGLNLINELEKIETLSNFSKRKQKLAKIIQNLE